MRAFVIKCSQEMTIKWHTEELIPLRRNTRKTILVPKAVLQRSRLNSVQEHNHRILNQEVILQLICVIPSHSVILALLKSQMNVSHRTQIRILVELQIPYREL